MSLAKILTPTVLSAFFHSQENNLCLTALVKSTTLKKIPLAAESATTNAKPAPTPLAVKPALRALIDTRLLFVLAKMSFIMMV